MARDTRRPGHLREQRSNEHMETVPGGEDTLAVDGTSVPRSSRLVGELLFCRGGNWFVWES